MGSNPPPVVTLYPSGTVIDYGESVSRIFYANVTQPATITFYFNGVAQAPTYGQIATLSCVNQGTHHVIRVVASNENGWSEATCNWYVRNEDCIPPVLERVSPASPYVVDAIGENRTFSAQVWYDTGYPPTVFLYFDNQFILEGLSATFTATAGTHTVKVVAIGCGVQEVSWTWYVPPTPASDPQHISPAYQKPVVTKKPPSDKQDLPDSWMDMFEPPYLPSFTVHVDQPAVLKFKSDDTILESRSVTNFSADQTFTFPLAYRKTASNLGPHVISITAQNSNGISVPVSWNWKLVPAIDQAVWEFKPKAGYSVRGFEFESRMNYLPFRQLDPTDFKSAGDYKLLTPLHGYTDLLVHSGPKGAMGQYRDFWQGSSHYYTAFSVYLDSGELCGITDNFVNLLCNTIYTMRISISADNKLQVCTKDDSGQWKCIRQMSVSPGVRIQCLDIMSEVQWVYDSDGSLPDIPSVNPLENFVEITKVFTDQAIPVPPETQGWNTPEESLELTNDPSNNWRPPSPERIARNEMQRDALNNPLFRFNLGIQR